MIRIIRRHLIIRSVVSAGRGAQYSSDCSYSSGRPRDDGVYSRKRLVSMFRSVKESLNVHPGGSFLLAYMLFNFDLGRLPYTLICTPLCLTLMLVEFSTVLVWRMWRFLRMHGPSLVL